MPAGAALSSSSRNRAKGGHPSRQPSRRASTMSSRGRGMPREPSRRAAQLSGSQRNLMLPSQRNSMRHPENVLTESGDNGRLSASMPTLTEDLRCKTTDDINKGNPFNMSISLDESVKTNPELFLTQDHIISDSFHVDLRHRATTPQNRESLGESSTSIRELDEVVAAARDNLQRGDTARIANKRTSPQHLKAKSSDTFHDDTERGDTPPTEQWWPSWMDPMCSVRQFTGKVVNDSRVQNIVLLMIIINSIMMGIATFPLVKEDPELQAKFELADQIFLILFTIESAMQLIYFGWKIMKDGFLVFDLLIVVMSWALEGAQVFRAFRIFRAVRLITRIETLKNLILALFSVVPKMTAIFMLLMLIFYIFAVMMTTLFKDMYEKELVEEPYFSTLYDSLFTLFQMMTLDEWAEIFYQVAATYSWAWIIFLCFVIITGFVVVNLIIAVICDAVHVLSKTSKDGLHGGSFSASSAPSQARIEEDDASARSSDMIGPPNSTELRLGELQMQLDEMVLLQDEMKNTIAMLIDKLRKNPKKLSIPVEDTGEMGTRNLIFENIANITK